MRVWGFEPIGDSKCTRCGEYQCVCGDPAIEEYILQTNEAERHDLQQRLAAELDKLA